jgi:hypothetical protein
VAETAEAAAMVPAGEFVPVPAAAGRLGLLGRPEANRLLSLRPALRSGYGGDYRVSRERAKHARDCLTCCRTFPPDPAGAFS